MLPLSPVEAGLANQAIVSATSTGSPPWDRLFIRRPASRSSIGIDAVMAALATAGGDPEALGRVAQAAATDYGFTLDTGDAQEVVKAVAAAAVWPAGVRFKRITSPKTAVWRPMISAWISTGVA